MMFSQKTGKSLYILILMSATTGGIEVSDGNSGGPQTDQGVKGMFPFVQRNDTYENVVIVPPQYNQDLASYAFSFSTLRMSGKPMFELDHDNPKYHVKLQHDLCGILPTRLSTNDSLSFLDNRGGGSHLGFSMVADQRFCAGTISTSEVDPILGAASREILSRRPAMKSPFGFVEHNVGNVTATLHIVSSETTDHETLSHTEDMTFLLLSFGAFPLLFASIMVAICKVVRSTRLGKMLEGRKKRVRRRLDDNTSFVTSRWVQFYAGSDGCHFRGYSRAELGGIPMLFVLIIASQTYYSYVKSVHKFRNWYYGHSITVHVRLPDGKRTEVVGYGMYSISVGSIRKVLEMNADNFAVRKGRVGASFVSEYAHMYDGDSLQFSCKLRGGTVKTTTKKTAAAKKTAAPTPTTTSAPTSAEQKKIDAQIKAAVTAAAKIHEKEKKELEKQLQAAQAKTLGDKSPPAKTTTSSFKPVGVVPKSKSKFSADEYNYYRQELLLWLDCNTELGAPQLKSLLVASFDYDLKRHILQALKSVFESSAPLERLELFTTLDGYYRFSAVVENQRVIAECLNLKQGSHSLAQFCTILRNNMTRLKGVSYEPPSNFVEIMLAKFSHLSKRELGQVLSSLQNLRGSDLSLNGYELLELALKEVDVLAQAQELARALHPTEPRGKGTQHANIADDDDVLFGENNGRGKGAKGKGRGKKGGAKGKFNQNAGGKGKGAGAQRWIKKITDGAGGAGGAAPRPRPPQFWKKERDWRCALCKMFNYHFMPDKQTVREACVHCKKPKQKMAADGADGGQSVLLAQINQLQQQQQELQQLLLAQQTLNQVPAMTLDPAKMVRDNSILRVKTEIPGDA